MSKSSKILIIEDERDLSDVYSLILSRAGYETAVAANGLEGLNLVENWQPKLILLDIFMPVMDGKTFLKAYNSLDKKSAEVIVCSNTADQKLMTEMKKLGARKVVTKADLSPSDLVQLVVPYVAS